MEQITLHLTGDVALLMHNNVTVNPLDEQTKAIKKYTSKRKKTEEDHLMIQRLEWEAGLYHDDEIGPYIPGVNVEICFRDAAKLTKQGAAVTRSVVVVEERLPLLFDGNRDIKSLWQRNFKDYRVAGNQQNSIMRCRPMFPKWELDVPMVVEASILDLADLRDIAVRAGKMIGLADYRPRFGRFSVTS